MPSPQTAPSLQALGHAFVKCPLCASPDLSYRFVTEGYPVCCCERCGLLFLNPQPATPPRQAPASEDDGVYDLNVSNASVRLDRLIDYAGTTVGRILLITGDPFLGKAAERRNLEVVSIDVGAVAAGAIPTMSPASFDAAIFYCSLERLSDPEGALRALKQVLTPSGALMVIAATVDSRTARLFRSSWWEFNSKNRFYFSADTLQSLLIKTGYGDPVIGVDERAVSLQYFRQRLPQVSSRPARTLLKLIMSLAPPFVRQRAFAALNSRRVVLVRSKPARGRPKLSVVVPAFNERATLATLLDRVLEKTIDDVDIELVLVESNSTDGTREVALKYKDHPRVRLILEDRPQGKGHAVRAGLGACTGDFVLFQDADLEYDIHDYPALVAELQHYRRNFVIGSRHSKSSVWKIRQFNDAPGLAAVFNLGHAFFLSLFNVLYRQELTDPFSMFKVFRRECLYGLTFECNRFDFDFEIVIKLLRKGYQPIELPVNYTARSPAEGKKVTMVRDPLTWLRALLKFRRGNLYANAAEVRVTESRFRWPSEFR